MRILICDDDPIFTDLLQEMICEYFRTARTAEPHITVYRDGDSLLADSGEIDILFLDIEMPGTNGILVGNRISAQYPRTLIFIVTSYPEYLDDAMRFHVFRYLGKPLDKDRLFRNLKDALAICMAGSAKIAIESTDNTVAVHAADIVCVEVRSRKVWVHTTKQSYVSVHPLRYWQEMLTQPCFFQTHRSFIVNLSHIIEFNHDAIRLSHMENPAYLTRRRYREFKERYLLYLASSR